MPLASELQPGDVISFRDQHRTVERVNVPPSPRHAVEVDLVPVDGQPRGIFAHPKETFELAYPLQRAVDAIGEHLTGQDFQTFMNLMESYGMVP